MSNGKVQLNGTKEGNRNNGNDFQPIRSVEKKKYTKTTFRCAF